MCVLFFSYKRTPGYKLILAANRDEFFSRPTASLAWWGDDGAILGGRDLQAGGTWLGVNRRGRFGALTNYRERVGERVPTRSRGEILHRYLTADIGCLEFVEALAAFGDRYTGFNLLVGEGDVLLYYSNRLGEPRQLSAGIHGLSNHLLDSSWPKVERGKRLFEKVLLNDSFTREDLFGVLGDTAQPPADRLPQTGVGEEWEKLLAPIFIHSETYGTRSSAVLTIADNGEIRFHERTYVHGGGYSDSMQCISGR